MLTLQNLVQMLPPDVLIGVIISSEGFEKPFGDISELSAQFRTDAVIEFKIDGKFAFFKLANW